MTSLEQELIRKIKELEIRLGAIERSNQTRRIVIDEDGEIATPTQSLIDSLGLNSIANFRHASVFNGAAGLSTASTSLVDVAGSSLAPLTVDRSSRIIAYTMGYGRNNDLVDSNGDNNTELCIYDSHIDDTITNMLLPGVPITNVSVTEESLDIVEDVESILLARISILTIAAGTHNFKLQYRAVNGGTAFLGGYELGFILLGS